MLSLKVVIDFVKLVDKFSKMKAENQSPEEAKQTNKQTNRKVNGNARKGVPVELSEKSF